MTSEYENGPELFDGSVMQENNSSEPVKTEKKVMVKKTVEVTSTRKKRVKKEENKDETKTDAAASEKTPAPKRRGRPPRSEKKVTEEITKEEKTEPAQTTEVVKSENPKEPVQQPQNTQSSNSGQSNQNHNRSRSQNKSNRQKNNYQKNNYQNRSNKRGNGNNENMSVETYIEDPSVPSLVVNDLTMLTLPALRKRALEFGITHEQILDLKRQELIVEILKSHTKMGGVILAYGALEILPDGYGFLRSPQNNYLSGSEDVYISISQIKVLSLKTGDTVRCQIRPPKDAERYFAMIKVETINYDPPEASRARASFDSLVPLYPDQRLNLEVADGDISTRIINLFSPIGKGQRSLIVAPPRAGKTILMQKIANSITENHPEVYLMVLLIDERPEEVTDMRRTVKGEVIASTFDEQATRHVSVAEMVIEKAKRLVEHKRDVVILLDNITRLARAYNQTVPASGKILSGGVDSNALHKPKRFLGAARNIEHGGSLTIIASALIETGSRMDEVIFEEFKGTGNNEIVLDRRMAERRLYPALNIKKSGTRREDLLLKQEESAKIWALRNAINPMEDIEMTEFLIDKMKKTKNNEAFLRSMNTGF
ncbi:MAG: transcription termination factor Rho [Sphaerochaetaceae bacterium]|nr:transcription termination factor Rho [Sphaerochaetaceae bacterium]MDC7246794.1 transcription termination factor Rho [Sphaerochaetaceae bacterium]